MEQHEHPERRQRLIGAASQALAAADAGDEEAVLVDLGGFVDTSPAGQSDLRELVVMLFHECGGMVTTLGSDGNTPVKMEVYDEQGEEVPIDRADPPVRTAVRTLLAEVHGDAAAAAAHVQIALDNANQQEIAALVLQALHWTIRLATECRDQRLPAPTWVTKALGW